LDYIFNFLKIQANHGGRDDKVRHVGDLGNIEANAQGIANVDITDSIISLSADGVNSVKGRDFVITSMPDDLGRGGHETSLTTGNSGTPMACGSIEIITNSSSKFSNSIYSHTLLSILLLFLFLTRF